MAEIKDPENTVIVELKDGNVVIELLADVAPKHAARMKELARAGEYDNVCFHRVIDGFMAQTGDVAHGDMEDGFNLRMDLPERRAVRRFCTVVSISTEDYLADKGAEAGKNDADVASTVSIPSMAG